MAQVVENQRQACVASISVVRDAGRLQYTSWRRGAPVKAATRPDDAS